MMSDDFSLLGLFISSFISSTLFPGGSEIFLAYLTTQAEYSLLLLITIATLGNTLGGMTSWGVGRLIAIRYGVDSLPSFKYQAAIHRYERWGNVVLLFSWLPVIGDPLCVAAGWLRIHWLPALLLIAIGKFIRYVIVVMLAS